MVGPAPRCEPFVSRVSRARQRDVSVVCGPWKRDPDDSNTVVNPTLLVEVLSPSTEEYDRGEKLEHYKRIPTLRACILVAHDRREMEMWTREADAPDAPWVKSTRSGGEVVAITAIHATLAVDAVYDDATEPS